MTNKENSRFRTFLRYVESGDLVSTENQFVPEYLEMEIENSLKLMHRAAQIGHLEIVKFFHEKKCSLEARDKNGMRPIHYASEKGHLNVLLYLVKNNCDIEAYNNMEKTPLHYACDGNHIDIVKFLLECGARIRACDEDGRRPIHYACRGGFVDLVKLLCENKFNIEQPDNNGWKPIHYVSHYGFLELVVYLVEQRCHLEIKDQEEEWTPMHHACNKGHLNVVRYLYLNNCSINVTDKNGLVPFDHACKNGHLEIVKFFYDNKYNGERIDERGMRPIHNACKDGQIDIVRFLFSANCNIEAQDNLGWRPIHHAISNSHKEVVKFLILNHCNKEATTNDGLTALDMAYDLNDETMMKLIQEDPESLEIIERIKAASKEPCGFDCEHSFCSKSIFSKNKLRKGFIDRGVFGPVYKIHDPKIKVDIAIKRFKVAYDLERKILIWQNFSIHERLTRYYTYSFQESCVYVFMEYAPGGSLEKKIRRKGPLEHQKIIFYCRQVLEALEYLHKNHIIHRNVKPRAMLLFPNDCVKLGNFELSKKISTFINKEYNIYSFVGTFYYIAPEVINGEHYEYSVDIWSLGASIVHMLTGKPPYFDFTPMAAIIKIGTTRTIEFKPYEPMSVEFDQFLCEILEPNPEKRPAALNLLENVKRLLIMSKSDFQIYFEYVQSGDLIRVKNRFKPEYLEIHDRDSLQLIHEAAKLGNLDIVKFLHQNHCNLEACEDMGKTPLHYACEGNHGSVVNFLLDSHSNIEACDKNGCRPIHYVCLSGYLDILEMLCEKSCNLESTDKRGWRPIHYVSSNGHLALLEYLDNRKCDLQVRSLENDWTPLHHACDGGHLDIVRYLYYNKCSFYLTDKNGLVPLEYACINGHLNIVKFFHDMGMDLEHRDDNGVKPVHQASKHGWIEIVEFLYDVHCDMDSEDMMSLKPIDYARKALHVDIVNFILSKTALKSSNVTTTEDENPQSSNIEDRIQNAINNPCSNSCDHTFCFIKKSVSSVRSGAFGTVYTIRDPKTDIIIAVKVMETAFPDGDKESKYLEHDISRYRKILLHERIIKYYGASIQNSKIFVLMEYADGGSLDEEIRKNGPLKYPRIIRFSKQILEGLTFLHKRKIIHRDIKPQNILMFPNECIKLCDFGLSRFIATMSKSDVSKNKGDLKSLVGTPNYMAPEVINGEPYGFSADIWSLGASIVHMLTGQRPYSKMNAFAAAFRIANTKIIEFQLLNPICDEFSVIHRKMLESNPTLRSSAYELLKDIDGLL